MHLAMMMSDVDILMGLIMMVTVLSMKELTKALMNLERFGSMEWTMIMMVKLMSMMK